MRIYTATARFDTGRPLTNDELFKAAPSIFSTTAHHSRSDRFQPIPTIAVLDQLRKEGFEPVGAKQAMARDGDRRDYAKHLIRLRRFDNVKSYQVGDTICEILLKNANDGTSAYDLLAGLFRIRCMNSLVSQESTIETVKVRHSGDVASKVIEGTYTVLSEAQKSLAAPDQWSRITLTDREREAFGASARLLRFGDADGNTDTPITAAQMVRPRRRDDIANDLWTTFNVAQENAIRGGLRATGRDANNRPRRVTTRGVNGIDQDVKLNRALFTLAAEMAKLKGVPLAA
ncbi:DUF932 domain-containing protein [Rhodopseudomonas palustris]|uniref:DUF932 domain-containing protein n=1 Tax=Rhodopseudomonas palustris TaxID=1076 RepID=UPI0022F0CF2A|nr:DUF932 domain-containing protein [Rhodopseudomonas palustris]WBU27570.1 DUF932 domain-containing protein [Rhodopseudomonas palustris]